MNILSPIARFLGLVGAGTMTKKVERVDLHPLKTAANSQGQPEPDNALRSTRSTHFKLRHCSVVLIVVGLMTASTARANDVQFPSSQPPYIVASRKTELQQRITDRLADYMTKVLGQPARIVASIDDVPAQSSAIVLADEAQAKAIGLAAPKENAESFTLETRVLGGRATIVAVGNTDRGSKRAVQRLIVKSEQRPPGLVIPELKVSESPWIPRREFTLCGWGPELVRGIWQNPNADKRLNVWVYSDQQVADYVAMFDSFGFSGCQLMDTVSNYAVLGSADAVQGQLKIFARALHRNGQDVTLWVWAAQFNDYGWFDPEITYTPEKGKTLFEDPKVRAGFERYYDGYAQLAPYVDLLIAHFYDPGQLKDRSDVFNYMHLLVDKFKAKNPQVKLGIDFWYADKEAEYMQQLIDHGFNHVLFLENTMPHTYPPGRREALHREAKRQGLEMGVWGWHTAEIETDQNPNMHVNAQLLSHFYRQIKNGVNRIHPITYWSEMEAYHLNNIFTMYAAGQLLWNPDRDPDEILREIAEGIWGPRNGPQVLAALHLIQDVRTGPTWDTYWIWLPTHRLGTPDPKEDLRRADEAIAAFEAMKTDPNFRAEVSAAVSTRDLHRTDAAALAADQTVCGVPD